MMRRIKNINVILRMHSLRPVPGIVTSYSSSMVTKSNLETNPFEDLIDTRKE
jgi:hypothetical protein